MLARNELIFRWSIYALAALLCLAVQGLVLQRLTIWGVVPFLYPLLAAIPATYEEPVPATVFALVLGVVCDLALPEAVPGFYTLVFPVVGLLSALLVQGAVSNGFLCSAMVAVLAYLLCGAAHCLALLRHDGPGLWAAGLGLALRELCVALPFTIPLTLLFRAVHRRTHWND